jgi:hypothetical protein
MESFKLQNIKVHFCNNKIIHSLHAYVGNVYLNHVITIISQKWQI